MFVLVIFKCLGSKKKLRHSVYSHLRLFENLNKKGYRCIYWNVANGTPKWLKKVNFNIIVLHTTFLSARYGLEFVYNEWLKGFSWVGDSNAIKIALPQDERYYSSQLCQWLELYKVDIVFSVLKHKPDAFQKVYSSYTGNAKFYPCLTGYIDQNSFSTVNFGQWANRRYDVIYRAKTLPLWVGRGGQVKRIINDKLNACLKKGRLVYDISADPKDTKYGKSWLLFLENSKTIIGSEAGGSGFDQNGEITKFIKKHIQNKKKITFENIDKKFSNSWDGHDFFVLGPRHLESIATGTCQILVEGSYSNILKPWKHYIPVKKDLSNLCEILKNIDWGQAQKIAQIAYNDIFLSQKYTYKNFALSIHTIITTKFNIKKQNNRSLWFYNALVLSRIFDCLGLISQIPHLSKLWLKKVIWHDGGKL